MTIAKGICRSLFLISSIAWAQSPSPPASPPTAPVPDWIVTSAPARFIVDLDQPDKPIPLATVSLALPDPSWVNLPIRVFTDSGTAVAADLLWSAPGQPSTLVFDSSSGAKRYKVYLGSNWPALHLNNPQSGVILESRAGDGKPIANVKDMIQAWNKSTTVYGRGTVEGIYEGGHRYGPQVNMFEHLQGWFEVTAPEHLQLAVISNDAAFVLVDGKEVAEWHGLHDNRGGWEAEHQGAVDLTPGVHLLECYNAFVQNGNRYHQLMCCVEVRGGALPNWTMLYPKTAFFRPMGHAHVVDYQLGTGTPVAMGVRSAPPFAFDWVIRNQSVIGADVTDIGFVSVRFTCYPPPTGTATWTFDDGTTAQGASIEHLFPRPGLRKVHLSVSDGTKELGSVDQTIDVHLNWPLLNGRQPELLDAHLADLMARDPTTCNASDLASCVAVFNNFTNFDALRKILPATCAKIKDFSEADLSYVLAAGLDLAQEDLPHFSEASQLLKALVDRCSGDKPSPQLIQIGSEARLGLAHLMLKTSDQTGEVKALLDGINVTVLSGDEQRAFNILKADLAMATGDIDGAKKQYQALTGDPTGADARSSIRRTALIGQARAFLDQKDFDSAEGALSEVATQAPIEKMSPDWALTRLRLYQEQGLPIAAYLYAVRLLPVITDSGRSELLFRLTDLAFAQGHDDVAKKALAELLQKHPYSEEAAQAKAKWPDKA